MVTLRGDSLTTRSHMIIHDDDSATGRGAFTLTSADGGERLAVEVPGALGEEFREHLAAHGFRVPEGTSRSWAAQAVGPAAWTAVGGVVVAFLRRHRGKAHRFEIEGRSVTVEGYSAKEAGRLAAD